MTSLETEMKAWTTNFSAWWESDGKVKFADVQKQVSAFFSGIPAAILGALGVSADASAIDINNQVDDTLSSSAGKAAEVADAFVGWLVDAMAKVEWGALAEGPSPPSSS